MNFQHHICWHTSQENSFPRSTIYDSKFGDCAAFPRGVPNFALGSNIPCFQQAALYPTPLYPDIWTWSPVRPSKLSSFPAWTGGLSCPVQVMEPSHLLAEGTEENSLLGYTTVTLRTFSGPTEAGRPSSLIFFFLVSLITLFIWLSFLLTFFY